MSEMGALTPAAATVIAAILSASAAIIVGALNSRSQRKKFSADIKERDIERAKVEAVRDAKLEMWMQQVDKKLDTHNGYAEKLGSISTDIAVIKNDIKTLYKQGGTTQ